MRNNLTIFQGDYRTLAIPVLLDGAATPLPLGTRIWLTVKKSWNVADGAALFQLSTDAGSIIIPDPSGNLAIAQFPPSATQTATPGVYEWDCKVEKTAGQPQVVDGGKFVIKPAITQAA